MAQGVIVGAGRFLAGSGLAFFFVVAVELIVAGGGGAIVVDEEIEIDVPVDAFSKSSSDEEVPPVSPRVWASVPRGFFSASPAGCRLDLSLRIDSESLTLQLMEDFSFSDLDFFPAGSAASCVCGSDSPNTLPLGKSHDSTEKHDVLDELLFLLLVRRRGPAGAIAESHSLLHETMDVGRTSETER